MTDAVLAGAFLGMPMASIFVAVGAVILLPYVDPKSPTVQLLAARDGNTTRFVTIVLAFYPAWATIGAVMGLVLVAIERGAPGAGMGSPNLVYTVVLVGLAVLMATPAAYFLRRSAPAVIVMGLSFAGVFGWALPHFAS